MWLTHFWWSFVCQLDNDYMMNEYSGTPTCSVLPHSQQLLEKYWAFKRFSIACGHDTSLLNYIVNIRVIEDLLFEVSSKSKQNVESNSLCVWWECVFTVASWGVGSPDVLGELKGPAVIPAERNMEADKRRDPSAPPKDKRDRDKRLKPRNHLTIYNGQAPVTSRIRGIGKGLSQPWPQVSVQAINSTLLSTQLISLSCSSSKLGDKKRADSKTKIKRWGGKDFTEKSSEQMLIDQRNENRRGQWWEKVNCVEGWRWIQRTFASLLYQLWPAFATDSQRTNWLCQLSNLLAHAEFFNLLFIVDIVWKDPWD